MKIDYNQLKEELENLSKEEILEMSVLLPQRLNLFYALRGFDATDALILGFEKKVFLPKEEALKIIHPLKFRGYKEYKKWIRENKIDYLPLSAHEHYNIRIVDLLGKIKIDNFLPVEKALEVVRPLKFKNSKEYTKWRKNNKRYDLPHNISKEYHISSAEFLGNNNIASKLKKFLSKKEAMKIVHPLKLKGEREYRKWKKDNKIINIPSHPIRTYGIRWPEFLGKTV